MSKVWKGNWPQRVRDRVADRNFKTITAFAADRPKATFFELAAELGNDIAPIQLIRVLMDEAYEQQDIEGYARNSLVRCIREEVPKGWGVEDNSDFKHASALSSWESTIPNEYADSAQRVGDFLYQSSRISKGWLPEAPDDEIIVEAFKEAGFSKKSAD
jgi:hypothetical protein